MLDPGTSQDTVGQALARATAKLRQAGVDEARANAELLLTHLLHTDRGGLFLGRRDPLDAAVAARYARWVDRRASREPLQHVTGEQEFYGLAIKTDRRALVPRPETEGLVEAALECILPRAARVVDLGTGTGCVAVALAVTRPDLEIDALDCSLDALDLARENAARHGVTSSVRFTRGDFTEPSASWRGVMHLVVSNPPYVSESEWEGLEPEVRDHDPRAALVAGPTGLEVYAALMPVAFELLRPGGFAVLELGDQQAPAVRGIATRAGLSSVAVRPDLRGIDRILVARRPSSSDSS